MAKKSQKKYSADFKAKVVIEILSCDQTLSQICSKHGISTKSAASWKATFLSNANLAFDLEIATSGYKEKIAEQKKEVDELHRQLGKRTAELEWTSKKLKSLDFNTRKSLVESKLTSISIVKQCQLLAMNRSHYYYKSQIDMERHLSLLKEIDSVYSELPFYGYRKVYHLLRERGFTAGMEQVRHGMRELGLKTIYPTKSINTTLANKEHKKYPYLLRGLEITKANQVWSTDITYIRVSGGFVYLAAVIDWYSKAILSYKISNTMDSSLVTSVLEDALENYGCPEIFNTDQGSQYTSSAHTDILIKKGIKISMDGKGRATDNIAIERFWRSAKYEDIYLHEYKTLRELKLGVSQYITFYNEKRIHQTLSYQRPMAIYSQSLSGQYRMAA